MKLCKCGRSIPVRFNSTIQATRCPSCELKFQLGKNREKTFFAPKRKKPKFKFKNKLKLACNRADLYFSKYIRLKHSFVINGRVYCKCIITGKPYYIRNIDNGHFISRGCLSVRYDEDNCRPQNRSSNRFKGEEHKEIFKFHLINEIGQERFDALLERQRRKIKGNVYFFEQIADTYHAKVNALIEEIKIENPWKKACK